MFWNILRMESDKVFRRRALWIGIAIATLLMVFYFIGFFTSDRSAVGSRYWVWPGGLTSALAFADGFSPGLGYAAYVLAVVVGMVTAQEYSWRTMQLWLSHGVPRPLLLLAKFVLALAAVLVIVLAFVLVGALASIFLTYQPHGSASSTLDVGALLLSYLRTSYGLLPYAALAFLLAIVSRSAAVAISGVVLFMLALEPLLIGLLLRLGNGYARVAQLLPAGLAQSMNQQNYTAAHLSMPTLVSVGQTNLAVAVICIAVYTLLFCGIALWVFQRQNLTN